MSEEKFIHIKADSEVDYGGCYYEGDTPGVEQSLAVTQYDDPALLLRALIPHTTRFDTLLEELGYIKKTKLDKTQKLNLEAQYAVIRRKTTHAYSDKFKIVDITDLLFAREFSCYDKGDVFELYQKVKMSDLKKVHPEGYAAYQNMKTKVTADNKRRATARVKAAATKKKKAIEQAKKLLEETRAEEAGEVGNE